MPRVLIALLAFACLCAADEVVLKNGQRFHGTVVDEDETGIWLEVSGGKIRLERRDIAEILRAADSAEAVAGELSQLLRAGAYRTAIRDATEALETYPDDAALRDLLAKAYLGHSRRLVALKRPYDAVELLKRALAACPEAAPLFQEQVESTIATIRGLDRLVELAMQALERRDYQTAYERFSAAATESPLTIPRYAAYYAVAMVYVGDAAINQGELGPATELYAEALALDPSLGSALKERLSYALGTSISERLRQNRVDQARREVNNLRRNFPGSTVGIFFDATVSRAENRKERAIQLYQKLLAEGDPLKTSRELFALEQAAADVVSEILGASLVDEARRWSTTTTEDWEIVETPHFRVRHKNRSVIKEIVEALENSLPWVADQLGVEFEGSIEVIVHPDAASYAEATGRHEWSGGLTTVACRGGRAISRRIDLMQNAPQLLDSVIPHELAHVVWLEIHGRHGTPLWLSEGLATLFESSYKLEHFRDSFSRRARAEALPPLSELFGQEGYPEEAEAAGDFYSHSHVITSYLYQLGGLEALVELGEKILDGRSMPNALRRVYGIDDVDELEERFLRDSQR